MMTDANIHYEMAEKSRVVNCISRRDARDYSGDGGADRGARDGIGDCGDGFQCGAPDFNLATSTSDPMAQIDNVTPGRTYEILGQAVNGSAQGLPSGTVTVTVPAPVRASRAVREAASNGAAENGASGAAKAATRNGNGNGNSAVESQVIRR